MPAVFTTGGVRNAIVAQLVEHQLPKLRVAGSSPVYRSLLKRFTFDRKRVESESFFVVFFCGFVCRGRNNFVLLLYKNIVCLKK